MILYYTGTGNSRYVAEKIAAANTDPILCLNPLLKAENYHPMETGGRLIVVTPTYAWRIPRLVEDYLERVFFDHLEKVWFVMTCGSDIGNAGAYNEELCRKHGWEYMGTARIVMPENYLAMFSVPERAEAEEIIAAADPEIERAGILAAEGKPFPAEQPSRFAAAKSGFVNRLFYKRSITAKPFTVSDECVSCGLCEKLCPTNTVRLEEGRPVWGEGCTHCMSCIARCPREAIEYGKKSRGKPRYHLD